MTLNGGCDHKGDELMLEMLHVLYSGTIKVKRNWYQDVGQTLILGAFENVQAIFQTLFFLLKDMRMKSMPLRQCWKIMVGPQNMKTNDTFSLWGLLTFVASSLDSNGCVLF